MCTATIAKTIIDAGCESVLVSLDGTAEIHNTLRRNPKAFDRTLRGLNRLLEARSNSKTSQTKIVLNCVLQPGNMRPCLQILFRIAAKYGADEVAYQLLSKRKYSKSFDVETAAREINTAMNLSNSLGIRAYQYPVSSSSIATYTSWYSTSSSLSQIFYQDCTYIYNNLRIDPAGNVIPCLEYVMGNIIVEDLKDIWNGCNFQMFREQLAKKGPFQACLRCCNN